MNKEELRALLAKELKIQEVPEELWQYLEERRFVDEALNPDYGLESLIREARAVMQLVAKLGDSSLRSFARGEKRRTSHVAHDVTTAFNSLLSPYEEERADILSRYYAWATVKVPWWGVRDFRDMMLGGTVLSWDQARAFLDSPALWFLSHEQFKALGVPIIGHSSRIVAQRWKPEKSTAKVYEVTLYIEWSGGTRIESIKLEWAEPISVLPPELNEIGWLQSLVGPFQSEMDIEKTHQFQSQPFQAEIIQRCKDDFGITGPPDWRTCKSVRINRNNETLYYYVQSELIWPGTILLQLAYISDYLEESYNWALACATMYVLTDFTPPRAPLDYDQEGLKVSFKNYKKLELSLEEYEYISMRIEPWVSAETVARIYRKAQRSILGHHYHPLGARSLALLRFIMDRIDDAIFKSWPALMILWNQTQPKWHYDAVKQFARDVNRALEAIGIRPIRKRDRKRASK